MARPVLFGADYSVYVRVARLALLEKGVDCDLVAVDVFAEGGSPPSFLDRHPFGRIPAFEHDGFRLYEAGAISRYVDEAFEGPPLQPIEPKARARGNQIISIADSYIYPHMVWGLYVELVSKVQSGKSSDPEKVAVGRRYAPICLKALAELMGDHPYLGGATVSLADLHVAPMLYYVLQWEDAAPMVEAAGLMSWWQRMSARQSMRDTVPAP